MPDDPTARAHCSKHALGPTTRDCVLGGRVTIVQPVRGYRAALDPIFLAAAVPARAGQLVIDAGCGVATAALCLAARVEGVQVIGIERDHRYAALAEQSTGLSGMSDRVGVVAGCLSACPIPPATADHVMTNPPFIAAGRGRSPLAEKSAAMAESDVDLAAWVGSAHRMLKPRGWLTMIHRADRIDDIVLTLKPRFGGLCIRPVHSHADQPARRVIVTARRDVRTPATIASSLVVHAKDGSFTPHARSLLEDAGAL